MSSSQKTPSEIAAALKANAATFLPSIPPDINPARPILEHYSDIAPEDIDAHLFAIVCPSSIT